MTNRSNIVPEVRHYYAEVGVILNEILKEDGVTLVRGVLDRLSKRSTSVQTLCDVDSPLHVALEVTPKHANYLWNPFHDSVVEEASVEYHRVFHTKEWIAKVDEFERTHLSDYGPAEDDELRIYIVVRRDVGDVLSKPKFGVQCAHATLSVWGLCVQKDPNRAYAYFPCNTDKIDTGQAKVVLQAKDATELLALAEKAKGLGFPVATIVDAARTELAEPTLTAIAIGPLWYKAEGKQFLKRVRLYQPAEPQAAPLGAAPRINRSNRMLDSWVDRLLMGMMFIIMGAVIIFVLGLAYWGIDSYICGEDRPGAHEHAGIITNVSFEPAHTVKHCSKGCYYTDVPDTWYARVCSVDYTKYPQDEDSWCHVSRFTHAPWDWQKQGVSVTIISHEKGCGRGWYYYAFRKDV